MYTRQHGFAILVPTPQSRVSLLTNEHSRTLILDPVKSADLLYWAPLARVELSLPVVGCSQSYCAWCSALCPIQTAQSQPSALCGGFASILKCVGRTYSEGSNFELSQAALVATRLHEGLPLLIQLTNNPMDFLASCTPSHIFRYLTNRHCDRQ